jgi:hypothetical protein
LRTGVSQKKHFISAKPLVIKHPKRPNKMPKKAIDGVSNRFQTGHEAPNPLSMTELTTLNAGVKQDQRKMVKQTLIFQIGFKLSTIRLTRYHHGCYAELPYHPRRPDH